MTQHTGRLLARERGLSALPGLVLFLTLGLLVGTDSIRDAWILAGIGMYLSFVFIEPYFASPRSSIVNSAGAIGACLGIPKDGIDTVWVVALVLLVLLFVISIYASIGRLGAPSELARTAASRLGRAASVGGLVLFLAVLQEAVSGTNGYQALAIGCVCLVASVSTNWVRRLRNLTMPQSGFVISAIGPRLVLVTGTGKDLGVGELVCLRVGDNSSNGHVVSRMPHEDGLRYSIALAKEWTVIAEVGFPRAVEIDVATESLDIVGSAGSGSTDKVVEFEPISELEVGDPILMAPGDDQLLYQVARLRLDDSKWAGSHSVVPIATARIAGTVEKHRLGSASSLPKPHGTIYRPGHISMSLEETHYQIGKIKGTDLEIGLRIDDERYGHIAILGMSGMGKTHVAQRICRTLGDDHVVIVLDTTGEYINRLGFPEWTPGDFDSPGHYVYETKGDPASAARAFIEECMTKGSDEYQAGEVPTKRMIMLEEAHTFLPEWNVARREQQEHVAFSGRMIMQARKFGISFMIVSQRTAVVSKSALSQCENYVILKTLDHTGLEYLESMVGNDMKEAIPSLSRYEAMCVGPAFNADEPVIVDLSPPE